MRKIGILIVGLNGAVSSMVTTGVFAIRQSLVPPLGLVTELPEFNAYDWLSPIKRCIWWMGFSDYRNAL